MFGVNVRVLDVVGSWCVKKRLGSDEQEDLWTYRNVVLALLLGFRSPA